MLRAVVLSLVFSCTVSACGSNAEPDAPTTPTASGTPTAEPAPTELAFGDAESVTWAPGADLSGELSITVAQVTAGDFEDFDGLDGSGITEANEPFYVDAVIVNEGDAELGGLDVPLYLEDSNGTLSPPWRFATPFKPCDSGPFPASFAAGEELETCLVFFGSPDATFESVTFRPSVDASAVTWTGEVAVRAKKPGKNPGPGKKKRR